MAEKNDWLVKTLIGMLWAVIFLWLTSLTTNLISCDKDARVRDEADACQRELIKYDVIRLDTNQKAVMVKLDDVIKKQGEQITAQAVMVNNQNIILDTLKEIKRDIK